MQEVSAPYTRPGNLIASEDVNRFSVPLHLKPQLPHRTMNAPRDISYEDELLQSLTDPTEAAAYLDAVIALEDEPALQLALRQVAKAQGMAETALTRVEKLKTTTVD